MPEIADVGYIVTDCEDAIRNSIRKHFPTAPLLRCWNHFLKSTENWITSNKKMNSGDVGFYCDSLRELFLQPNENLFSLMLKNKINGYTNSSGNFIPPW